VTYAIISGLLVLTGLCMIILRQDARQRRVNHQVSVALTTDHAPIVTKAAPVRLPTRHFRRDYLLHILLNYRADAPCLWPGMYTVAAGIGAMVLTIIVGGIVGSLILPWWAQVIGGIVDGCLVMRMLFTWQQRRCTDQLMRQLPDVIEMIVSAIRAGLPISEAFHIVARETANPTREQFASVTRALNLGHSSEKAIRTIYERTHVEEYAIFSVTLAVQSRAGGRLAETLGILGNTIRERVALAGRAKALASETQLSARVLSAIPFIAGIALYILRPDAINPLFNDPRGQKLFATGLISVTLGIITMRRMIRKGTTV
jgi:tight adherence protein B